MAYCDADLDEHVCPIFNPQRGRLGLPSYMAGVGLRAWREHRHAAFVGMVAQSCASAQLQFGRVTRVAYPGSHGSRSGFWSEQCSFSSHIA